MGPPSLKTNATDGWTAVHFPVVLLLRNSQRAKSRLSSFHKCHCVIVGLSPISSNIWGSFEVTKVQAVPSCNFQLDDLSKLFKTKVLLLTAFALNL